MYPSQAADKFVVRLPEGMRDRLRRQAKANQRTMNSEVIYHLDRALADENENGPAATAIAPDLDPSRPR